MSYKPHLVVQCPRVAFLSFALSQCRVSSLSKYTYQLLTVFNYSPTPRSESESEPSTPHSPREGNGDTEDNDILGDFVLTETSSKQVSPGELAAGVTGLEVPTQPRGLRRPTL
jgi:hypothetical protein